MSILYVQSLRWLRQCIKAGYGYNFLLGLVEIAVYHEHPTNCPTYEDSYGCRCMTEPS